MARTKKATKGAVAAKASPKKDSRPYTALFVVIFAVSSAIGMWLMRIETGIKDLPVNFVQQVEAKTYANGLPVRTHYTGITAIDSIYFLVIAFIAGPLGWDEGVRLQQLHFLVQFFAVIAVWNVEACRARNSWRLLSFTALFALFYQTVGGAVIIPLYYLTHTLSTKSDTYYRSGRAVSLPYARGLLFSLVVGYLVPTLAMYIPGLSAETAQLLTFIWQPAPLFVNILLLISSFLLPSTSTASSRRGVKNLDVKHLKRVYAVVGTVSAINHVITLYVCATSSNPQLSFSYVFLPNRDIWMQSTTAGLHYIFQIDWWGCFMPTLFWCWVAVYDVHRLLLGAAASTTQLIKWAVYIVALTVALGPGGMLAVVWSWREDRLIMIESGVRGTIRKPKTA
ncbi:hypothetical protein HD806DRAFT_532925 [Xylariaceae sp. AK1471]|nr:hypothetical protein HD806DRAFT_532925 [Xylariaceae sp. AK1471]